MTQNEAIKQHLEQGNTITPLEALNLFGCFRLGARIHELKNDYNLPIVAEMVTINSKRVARYSIKK